VLMIGIDPSDEGGVFIEWQVPENVDGEMMVGAYHLDGREIHSSAIKVRSRKPVAEGTGVVRSDTIVAITVYREPPDTAEIVGAMYPDDVVEVVGKNSNGRCQI